MQEWTILKAEFRNGNIFVTMNAGEGIHNSYRMGEETGFSVPTQVHNLH